jgi:hypothetical protein
VQVGVFLAQGNNGDAGVALAGAMMPGGFDKLARFAKNIPADKAVALLAKQQDAMASTAAALSTAGQNRQFAGGIADAAKLRACPVGGSTCFVAGTQVVMGEAEPPLMVSAEADGTRPSEAVLAGVALLAVGWALDQFQRRLGKPPRRLPSRRRARDNPRPQESPAVTPPPENDSYRFTLTPPPEPVLAPLSVRPVAAAERPKLASRLRSALTLAMLACFAVGGWLLASSWPSTGNHAVAVAPSQPRYVTKNIEDIQVGDLVLARDEHGREIGYRPVKEVYRRTSFHLRHLTFRDATGQRQTLLTTDEHPFWSATRSEFVDAGKLKIGDRFTSPDGRLQTLVDTRREERPDGVAVFNFQVDDFHTYYVQSQQSQIPLLVHNANCPAEYVYHGTDAASAESISAVHGLNRNQWHAAAGGSGVDPKDFSVTTDPDTARIWAEVRAAERGSSPAVIRAPANQVPLHQGSSGSWADPNELFILPEDFSRVGPGVFQPIP